jgi:hypothetical protein
VAHLRVGIPMATALPGAAPGAGRAGRTRPS